MAVCVRGVFRLAPNEPVVAIEDPIAQGFMSGDTFADDDVDQLGPLTRHSDFADWKLNAEVLLKGACHPPGGPSDDCAVRFSVGDWSKTLRVRGPRAYKPGLLLGGKEGEAQPFDKMPLTWQNAYGGEGFAENPAGRGFRGEELPTVEYADKPIKKVGARGVQPATFLPISPNWPQRSGKRGRNYGAAWKRTRAPFYSDDFDWTYFHEAPADQQLDGYLRGDETLTFENLHPAAASWQAKLPALRIRVFVKTTDARIFEPEMQLDTLLADLDDEKLELVWRGHCPIRELDMSDVGVVLLAAEDLADAPKPADEYIAQLGAFEDDPVGVKAAMPPGFMMVADAIEAAEQAELNGTPMPDLKQVAANLPAGCPFPPWFLAAVAGDDDPLGVKAQLPDGLAAGDPMAAHADAAGGLADAGKQQELVADVGKLAEDPSGIVDVLNKLVELAPPDKRETMQAGVDAFERGLDAGASGGKSVFDIAAETASSAAPQTAAEGYGGLLEQTSAGIRAGEEVATGAEQVQNVAQAKQNLASAPQSLDDAVAGALAPLDELEVPAPPPIPDTGADLDAAAAKLDQDDARMRGKFGDHPLLGLNELGRNVIANAPTPASVAPDLSPIPAGLRKAQDAILAMGVSAAAVAPLSRLIAKVDALVAALPQPEPLPEGEFVGADLRGRDFSGRDLREQRFVKADLTGASFRGADLTGADLTRADLTGADLSDAVLTEANLANAILNGAKLVRVRAARADLKNAEAAGADATEADLEGATLAHCKAEKIVLRSARLKDANLRFADLSKADLRDAVLTDADLGFAQLVLAKADRADLSGCNLDIARLNKSRLHEADLRGARSTMGEFLSTNFTAARMQGVQFSQVDMTGATLDGADLEGAALQRSTLRDTTAERASFRHADLARSSATGAPKFVDCDFRHSSGARSVWMDADLSRSDFRHSQFPDAYFQGARGDGVDFRASVMKRANFRKVAFRQATFAHSDLAGAVFQDAGLDDGDFHGANCYDAKFLGARAVRCNFRDAFTVAVQLDDPDRKAPGEGGGR